MTSIIEPKLMNDFTHLLSPMPEKYKTLTHMKTFFAGKTQKSVNAMRKLQANFAKLNVTINERNMQRDMPCNAYNPSYMVTGVSI